MEWSKEIEPAIYAVLEALGSLLVKLEQEPQDNWRATLARDSVYEMHSAIVQGVFILSTIEDHLLKKPDNLTRWLDEQRNKDLTEYILQTVWK